MSQELNKIDIDTLTSAVNSGYSAIRLLAKLQPAAGPGSKVFPPSHSEGKYAWEARRVEGGEVVRTVLLDSVQSQANRMEQALKEAYISQRINFPLLAVDFGSHFADIGEITTLDAPHRIADAIFRDSLLGDQKFPDTNIAKAYSAANQRNATALYQYCPHALIFGIWDSTGSAGGLGNKFQRAVVSEIVGIKAEAGVLTSSRLDPLGIKTVDIYAMPDGGWTTDKTLAETDKKGEPVKIRPSEVNHSNIPPTIKKSDKGDEFILGGVTIDYARQTTVLSLPALRRLHFPVNGEVSAQINTAARTVLAALGLAAIVHQLENGYDLRSRCLLIPEGKFNFELVDNYGESKTFSLSASEADALFTAAVTKASGLGLSWNEEKIQLQPTPDLFELVRMSRDTTALTEE
ncbi:CRISPR-associated Csx4 family protein [Methylobacter tundripaludum]|uniref:CRISPR-associated Csx4 family protein n=1 Tax=Methylobacter tundripaludum TaxID=173365 RepID=A0A2S6H5S4_9GAMM|nr:type I-U CRISPR-associated RAMP protein Csb1/Cas7u [Methylobacter tundripaludum]PPK72817.1 CRISPR-associated Csx4 family protein [Methylobacter tundripaludum]